jgi:hypothetical protein
MWTLRRISAWQAACEGVFCTALVLYCTSEAGRGWFLNGYSAWDMQASTSGAGIFAHHCGRVLMDTEGTVRAPFDSLLHACTGGLCGRLESQPTGPAVCILW